MSIGTAIGAGALLSTAGGVTSGILGANAAGKAATTQADAAEYAANLQAEEEQENLGFQEGVFNTEQANEAPFLQSGSSAAVNLDNLLGITPSTFGTTPVPDQGPVQFPQFSLSGTSPNPTVTNPPGSPALTPAGSDGAFAQPFTGQNGGSLLSMLSPQQQAAEIEGFGNPNAPQGGPVAAPGQGPVTISANGNPAQATAQGTSLMSMLNPGTNGSVGVEPSQGQGSTQFNTSGLPPGIPQSALAADQFTGPQASTGALPAGGPAPAGASSTPGTSGVPLSSLINPNLGASGSLMQPWDMEFQAPTAQQAEETPGFQFQLQQGLNALNNSAAAQGSLESGGSQKALANYAEGLASTNYQQTYNNALTQYQQAYNQFQQNQANQFNRLADLAGYGQVSAGQLNSGESNIASGVGNSLLTSGAQIGQDVMAGANATASGYINQANAYGGIANSVGGLGVPASLLAMLGQNQSAGSNGV